MTPQLRPYQLDAIADLRKAFREGCESVILYSPTGSGKTVMACKVVEGATARGSRVIFMGDSQEIIEQTSASLERWGIPHGIIMGSDSRRRPWLTVHVATIQTLARRGSLPPRDLVIVDECHLARAASWERVIQEYRKSGARVIGLSATPCRLDQRGLGKLFQRIVYCPSVAALTAAGYLAPMRIFAPSTPDLGGVHTTAGDYKRDELSRAMDRARLTGDIVAHWLKLARGRTTIVAATSIAHSKHIVEQFRAEGIAAEHADGTLPREVRRRILGSLGTGQTTVLSQVDICGKGWDCPRVSCCIDARPTQSLARWLQFVGRGGRIADQKRDCVLLDHAGNVIRFGFPDEEREWTLDDREPRRKPADRDPAESVRMCKKCFLAFRSTEQRCPACGWEWEGRLGEVETTEGELEEITKEKPVYTIKKLSRNPEIAKLQQIAAEKNYSPGWVWHQMQRLKWNRSAATAAAEAVNL